jgi:hypothetical protein
MTATLAEKSEFATVRVARLSQTGGERGIALEGGGWDRQADEWDRIFRELENIRILQEDWDGLGAKAPSAPLLESAVGLARFLSARRNEAPSSVAAGPDGTILFNWQNEAGYLDAEVTKPYLVEWMLAPPGQRARHWVTRGFSSLYPREASEASRSGGCISSASAALPLVEAACEGLTGAPKWDD